MVYIWCVRKNTRRKGEGQWHWRMEQECLNNWIWGNNSCIKGQDLVVEQLYMHRSVTFAWLGIRFLSSSLKRSCLLKQFLKNMSNKFNEDKKTKVSFEFIYVLIHLLLRFWIDVLNFMNTTARKGQLFISHLKSNFSVYKLPSFYSIFYINNKYYIEIITNVLTMNHL